MNLEVKIKLAELEEKQKTWSKLKVSNSVRH